MGARELFHHCYNLTLSCWKLVCFDFSSSVTPNRLLSLSISSHLTRDCVRKYGQICIHRNQTETLYFTKYQIRILFMFLHERKIFLVCDDSEQKISQTADIAPGWRVLWSLATGQPPQVIILNLNIRDLGSDGPWSLLATPGIRPAHNPPTHKLLPDINGAELWSPAQSPTKKLTPRPQLAKRSSGSRHQ